MNNNEFEINIDNDEYDYVIVNIKKELDNFIFVDIIDKSYFNNESLQKIENINNDLNRILSIDYNLIKNDLLKIFKNEDNILKQFDCDINRCNFYINDTIIKNPSKEDLKLLLKNNYLDFFLFCNQSLYGFPCQYIQDSIKKQDLFIGNFNNNDDKGYNLNFKIYNKDNKELFTSSKKLKIIQNFKNNLNVILDVNIKIEIDLKNKSNIFIEFESSI